jgi:ubiquinone/menaquinone biosynthesis C-methylase UbiE
VTGLERSPSMLAEARRRHPRLSLVLGDAHELPFRSRAVDLSVFVTTLEFLERPGVALGEAARVARRGVLIVALNRWSAGALAAVGRRCARIAAPARARLHAHVAADPRVGGGGRAVARAPLGERAVSRRRHQRAGAHPAR